MTYDQVPEAGRQSFDQAQFRAAETSAYQAFGRELDQTPGALSKGQAATAHPHEHPVVAHPHEHQVVAHPHEHQVVAHPHEHPVVAHPHEHQVVAHPHEHQVVAHPHEYQVVAHPHEHPVVAHPHEHPVVGHQTEHLPVAHPHIRPVIHPPIENHSGHPILPHLQLHHAGANERGHHTALGNDLPGRIVHAIRSNEGGLTNITTNDNGHGISIGIRQWNQRRGELPDLLRSLHAANPAKFDTTFGPYSSDLQHEGWVRSANMAGNPDLMMRLGEALHDPQFQKVQVDLARQFAQKSIHTAQLYGLKTEAGAALVADITNQMGDGGARRIFAQAGLQPGGAVANEAQAMQNIERASHRPNSRDRFNAIATSFGKDSLIHAPAANGKVNA
jgi:hypothetical protein